MGWWADELAPALDPKRWADQRLAAAEDDLGRWWTAPLASAEDVRHILDTPGHERLLPGGLG